MNPIPIYQQGSPGQPIYNYQPGVPLQANAQQPTFQQPNFQQPTFSQPTFSQPTFSQPIFPQPTFQQPTFQQPIYQQPGQIPNIPGVPINIQQLTQTGSALQPTNTQALSVGNQQIFQPQTVPFGTQPNSIPINTLQQATFPFNQQFVPQIGNTGAPGPVIFPG